MTILTNSDGTVLTHTNEFLESILLQFNSSNTYYTSGKNAISFTKIGSNKILLLDYNYFTNTNIVQNCTINENTINDYNLEFVLNNTSNEYTLQGVYNASSLIGTITELSQVYLRSNIRHQCSTICIYR